MPSFGALDALHVACAESAGVEEFLTTDDSLRFRALYEASKLSTHVDNFATWYAEVIAPCTQQRTRSMVAR
jgi:hypothetical protein